MSRLAPDILIFLKISWFFVWHFTSSLLSKPESVPCFDFNEESVNASREHNIWIREFKTFIYTLLIYRPLKIIIIA